MFHYIYSICVDFILDFQELTVSKTPKQHKKSAAEGGRLLRLFFCLLYSQFLEVQNHIYTYWVCLMEHIYFEAQVCINISSFKENSNIDRLITLCLGTSLIKYSMASQTSGSPDGTGRSVSSGQHSITFFQIVSISNIGRTRTGS